MMQPTAFFYQGFGLAVFVTLLDQLQKWHMLEVVRIAFRPPIEVTPFFNLVMVWNTGISFGMFADDEASARWVLFAVSALIVVALLAWLWCVHSRLVMVALGLVIGGALGNMIDRVRFGAVADFFDFHVLGYHWPAFNIADAAIFIGVVLLLWDSVVSARHDVKTDEGTIDDS